MRIITARPDRFVPCPKKGMPEKKQPKPIAKVSARKKKREAEDKARAERMDTFFKSQRPKMTGVCMNCGGPTSTDDKYYKFCLAHFLPKSLFESVATHPLITLELCFFSPSCHSNTDNKIFKLQYLKCWPEIVRRFKVIYPLIAASERRHIPEVLLQELSPA